jgi:cob(I)alamin adenosyltransferase
VVEVKKGLFLINTGTGKGKTTAAIGTLIRALGHGHRAAFIQFIKISDTGESRFLADWAERNPDRLRYAKVGLGFIRNSPDDEDRAKARQALELAFSLRDEMDLIVLDEVNIAVSKGLIPLDDLTRFVTERPAGLSLVFTGRGCPQELVDLADTVTEMTEIKHAYRSGIPARKGIDF